MSTRRALRDSLVCTILTCGCGTRGDLSLGRIDGDASVAQDTTSADEAPPTSAESNDASPPSAPATDTSTPATASPSTEADASSPSSPCLTAIPEPAERFDFSGSGTTVVDRMGGPSGTLFGGVTLTDDGSVELDGDDDYVDLPNGLLGTKTSATILLWTTLRDGPAYWRVLDFGNSSEGEDPTDSAVGTTYVALTTETGLDPNGLALFIGHGGASSEDRALTALNLGDTAVALGIVLDGEAGRADLYVDGRAVASTPMSAPLSELDDVNNWLGRSQYSADPHYPGTYTELRVYDRALTDCEVAALTDLGPDAIR